MGENTTSSPAESSHDAVPEPNASTGDAPKEPDTRSGTATPEDTPTPKAPTNSHGAETPANPADRSLTDRTPLWVWPAGATIAVAVIGQTAGPFCAGIAVVLFVCAALPSILTTARPRAVGIADVVAMIGLAGLTVMKGRIDRLDTARPADTATNAAKVPATTTTSIGPGGNLPGANLRGANLTNPSPGRTFAEPTSQAQTLRGQTSTTPTSPGRTLPGPTSPTRASAEHTSTGRP